MRDLSLGSPEKDMARSPVPAFGAAMAILIAGCGGPAVPDPRNAIAEYERAVAAGDADRVYSLLTAEARTAYGRQGTRRLLTDARAEIASAARAAASPGAVVHAEAVVPYVDGEKAVLELENGRFRISGAAGLPSSARTPAQALSDLRAALARRSYAALVRVLSADTRAALERDLRSMQVGLEHPESLRVRVRGESAEVDVPFGHKVLLKREAGVWRVYDLE